MEPDTAPAWGHREAWAIMLIVGTTLPLFALHLRQLWKEPHYQFFPLLLGIGVLAWQRWPRRAPGRCLSWLGIAFPLLGLTVLAAGVLLFSPRLATVAVLLTAGGLILGLAEPQTRRELLPLWVLLWLLLPLPLDWDHYAITQFQKAVSRVASLALDVFGVGHLVEGHVVVLPGHHELAEEAYSGIDCLFTALAMTALFVVAARRPLIWSGLLLASSMGWAVLTNAARVVAVAVVQVRYDRDLFSGWPYTAIGLAEVGVALLMVVCTDRLLAFLLGPIVPLSRHHRLNWVSRAWNWCLGWSGGAAREAEREAGLAESPAEPPGTPDPAPRSTEASGTLHVPRWIVASFVTLGVLQLGGLTICGRGLWTGGQRLSQPDLFQRPDLPATIGDWKQVDYTTEEHQGDWGDFRQTWTYRSPHGEGQMSVAYPFRGWHDLRRCYSGAGWKIWASAAHPDGSGDEATTFRVQTLVVSQEALSAAQQQAVHSLFLAARQPLVSAYLQQRQAADE